MSGLMHIDQQIRRHQKPVRRHENKPGQLETSPMAISPPLVLWFDFPSAWPRLGGRVTPPILLSYPSGEEAWLDFAEGPGLAQH